MLNQPQITTNYFKWRDDKLALYPLHSNEHLFVNIANPSKPSKNELKQLTTICQQYNMVFYRFNKAYAHHPHTAHKKWIHYLGKQLGLQQLDKNICADEDKLTAIEVRKNKGQHLYIPYTKRKLSWHTDGYYNIEERKINSFLLHCARPAQHGGTNFLLDHEMVFILLHEENPDFITALLQPDAMTIPANILDGKLIREAQTGSVFSFNTNGKLHMRYSARLKNIEWKQDVITQQATQFLQRLWQQDSCYKIKATLQTGEGLICNNVLHCRTAFEDSNEPNKKRLLYRGRYLERISSIK